MHSNKRMCQFLNKANHKKKDLYDLNHSYINLSVIYIKKTLNFNRKSEKRDSDTKMIFKSRGKTDMAIAKNKGHKKKDQHVLKMGKITIWTQKPSFVHKNYYQGASHD